MAELPRQPVPAALQRAEEPDPQTILDFLRGKGVDVLTWSDWEVLDAHERSLGEEEGRERVKVVEREDMLKASEPDKA